MSEPGGASFFLFFVVAKLTFSAMNLPLLFVYNVLLWYDVTSPPPALSLCHSHEKFRIAITNFRSVLPVSVKEAGNNLEFFQVTFLCVSHSTLCASVLSVSISVHFTGSWI